VRGLALDLRPPMLDDLGLVAALRWYLDRQARRVGYEARFRADPEEIPLGPAAAIIAYRVAQEALTNVARHAHARRVLVRLRVREGILHLVVGDDGVGFDPEGTLRRGGQDEGMGLLGMRERAALCGGRVDVRSSPGRRTRVYLRLPLGRSGEEA
jgi:signal transduction histidine kinase